jgi:hypothetical protein
MRAIVVLVMLVVVSISPANAARASVKDRMRMSVSISDYIHYHDRGKSNAFKTDAVEVGAAAIEGQFALADWRSADGRARGQVLFFYVCDDWNVGAISTGRPLSIAMVRMQSPFLAAHLTEKIASKLAAEVTRLEVQHVAYLKPTHPRPTC